MMSLSRNRVIEHVLKSRMQLRREQIKSAHCLGSQSESSSMLETNSSGGVKNTMSVVGLPLTNVSENYGHKKKLCKSVSFSKILCSVESDYALMHAFSALAISSIHLPPSESNTLTTAILPPMESGKALQITVPALRQHIVQDPAIRGVPPVSIEEPVTPTSNVEKRAERLIVLRRRKMKKHKLKKLRKKMKYEFLKVRSRREKRKEAVFQAELLGEMKAAEEFNAEKWAEDILNRSKTYARQRAEAEFWASEEGGRLRHEIYLNTRKIPPDQR